MEFQLHPRLKEDCIEVGHLQLSRLLMMNDKQYPWFMLVPEKPDITEIYQLSPNEQCILLAESSLLAETLMQLYKGDKMNIAAIGNLVPQLHIHHIVRYQNDKAWPAPVWGKFTAIPYSKQKAAQQLKLIRDALAENLQ